MPRRKPSPPPSPPPRRWLVGVGEGLSVYASREEPDEIRFVTSADRGDVRLGGTWLIEADRLKLIELNVSTRLRPHTQGVLAALGSHRDDPSADPESRSITGEALRAISVPELERLTLEAIKHKAASDRQLQSVARRLKQPFAMSAEAPTPEELEGRLKQAVLRPPQAGYEMKLYVWVAERYLELLQETPQRVNIRLASDASRQLGHEVTSSQARDWVHRARELELLTRVKSGRAGGQAGPRLLAIWRTRGERDAVGGPWSTQAPKPKREKGKRNG